MWNNKKLSSLILGPPPIPFPSSQGHGLLRVSLLPTLSSLVAGCMKGEIEAQTVQESLGKPSVDQLQSLDPRL